jgi:hypothetical protein
MKGGSDRTFIFESDKLPPRGASASKRRGMEAGLSDRALKVLRAALHEKTGMDLAEMPDPALVADQISLFELAC